MKNAFVLVHHHGDNGNAPEGAILRNITNDRFEKLEKAGLVREATDEDLAAQPQLDPMPGSAEEQQHASGGEKQAEEPLNKAAPATKTKVAEKA